MAARESAALGSGPGGLAAKYRSLFVVGRGGMGSVEAALDIGHEESQRVVALKRLLPDAARDGRRVEMFMREAKLAALLEHPNVVRAYDFGEIDGELYLAMEYVEGQPLSRVLQALADAGDKLDPSLVAYVLGEVCAGLHAAHELVGKDGQPLALVHRDVSPQNVMLAYDGHVRLLDFGVAKIEAESVTKTGEVKGKTAYMSPEQAMGDPIDRRSDLFGVGAVLYECSSLRRMWGAGTDMEVIRKLALEAPPPLEGAPAEMIALYMRLVAREASDRPTTAGEVADALAKLVPQGTASAAKELRGLLERHFGPQATEGRRRLREALEDVAPDQAKELRESALPAVPRDEASGRREAIDARKRAPKAGAWLAIAGLVVAGVVAWRLVARDTDKVEASAPDPSVSASGAPVASAPPVERASPTASASATSATSVNPVASAPPSASAIARAPIARPVTSAPAISASSKTMTPAAPAISAKPPDLDDHPF
ncbi:MAG: protein kinase [Labilithrix sp.]|nr:protein kinase [Labilithrix sp.]